MERSLGSAREEAGHLRGQLSEARHHAGATAAELEQAKGDLEALKEVMHF